MDKHSDASYDMFDQTERVGAPLSDFEHAVIVARYNHAAKLVTGKDALEIGPGFGIALPYLSTLAKSLVAGEYSAENIDLLKKSGNDVCPVIRLDGNRMAFADRSFDVIIAMAMIYYLDIDAFLSECHRCLRQGGTVFFDTSNKSVPGFWPSPYTTAYYTVPELAKKLNDHGFEARFYGAFPAPGGYLKRKIRAIIKDGVKCAVQILPGGRTIWQKIRKTGAETGTPLPLKLENMTAFASPEAIYPVNPDAIDRSSRIIYVEARKKA